MSPQSTAWITLSKILCAFQSKNVHVGICSFRTLCFTSVSYTQVSRTFITDKIAEIYWVFYSNSIQQWPGYKLQCIVQSWVKKKLCLSKRLPPHIHTTHWSICPTWVRGCLFKCYTYLNCNDPLHLFIACWQ